MADNNTTTTTQVVVNKEVIICPKCKKELNAANTKCPACGTILRNTQTTVVEETKEMVIPDYCPICHTKFEKTYKYCIGCGASLQSMQGEPNAKMGVPLNKGEYHAFLFNSNEMPMVQGIVDSELAKIPDYKKKSLPAIERRKVVMTVILAIIILIINTIYASFHTNLGFLTFMIVVALVVYFKMINKNDIRTYITNQVKLRPNEKISYIVASTLSASNTKHTYIIARILIFISGLLISLALFATPHYIYEKVDNGYNLRYYTLGIISGSDKAVVPSTYKNEPVVGIRGDVFKNVKTLKEIEIADSVIEIRGGAFEGCSNLEKVKLSNSLKRISGSMFKDCYNLKGIIVPDSVEEIDGGAFANCQNLETVHLPGNLKTIGGESFKNCRSLKSIIIPGSVEDIGGESFMDCYNLEYISLSPKLTEIHGSTFENCSSLDNVTIPEGVTRIGGSAFRYCRSLKNVTIPRSANEIRSSAFRGTAIDTVCISQNAYVDAKAFKETSAKVAYYESDCLNPIDINTGADW